MPTAPLRPCVHPGCAAFAQVGNRCAVHAKHTGGTAYDAGRRRTDAGLAAAAALRSSSRWQKFRAFFRDRHPLCCDPFGAHIDDPRPVAQIHHVEPLAQRPDLALVEANCRPLCTACHGRVERLERAGTATQHLFPSK